MKKIAWSNMVLAAAMVWLSGCGQKSENAISEKAVANYPLPDPPVVVTCPPGKPGGKFIVAELGDPKTFNYLIANESSSMDIGRLMFWGLLNFDAPTQTVKPGLAESWTNSPDGKTWTFHLRKNLRWSDGAPLTADDVIFTWNDVVYNPAIPSAIKDPFIMDGKQFTVTKVDDLTIRVVTPKVYAPFLAAFGAGVTIYPKHILAKYVANGTFSSAYGVNWKPEDIIGSGPYCLKEYKPAQYTLLERNPYFCEVDSNSQRLPYFDDIIFTVVPDMNAMSLRFLSGESDADDFIYPYEYDRFKTESTKGRFRLLEPGVGLENSFFWFNQNTNVNAKTGKPYVDPVKLKWFRNLKFRQACSYAIDREAIIRSVYSGRGIPAYGFLTPGYGFWYDPNIKKYSYDPARALELLKEIGIEKRNGDDFLTDAEGNRIEFVLNTNTGNSARGKTAVLIATDLEKLGMKVTFQPIEFNTLITKIDDTYDYECILLGLYSDQGTDPGNSMNNIKSSGYTHMWFPRQQSPATDWEARMDQLMDMQMQTLNLDERKKYFDEVQEILAEQVPFIFTVTPMYYAAIRSDIGNVRPTSLSYYRATWNAEELYFEH